MNQFLSFETMLTPKIITFVYWILLLAAVISGVGSMFTGYGGYTFGNLIKGLLIAAGGSLAARIWCEIMIVMFKMNGALQVIKNK